MTRPPLRRPRTSGDRVGLLEWASSRGASFPNNGARDPVPTVHHGSADARDGAGICEVETAEDSQVVTIAAAGYPVQFVIPQGPDVVADVHRLHVRCSFVRVTRLCGADPAIGSGPPATLCDVAHETMTARREAKTDEAANQGGPSFPAAAPAVCPRPGFFNVQRHADDNHRFAWRSEHHSAPIAGLSTLGRRLGRQLFRVTPSALHRRFGSASPGRQPGGGPSVRSSSATWT